jgi:hypothetical protein
MKIAVNLFILVFLATASVACKDSKKPLLKETKTELVNSSQPDLKKTCCATKEAKSCAKKDNKDCPKCATATAECKLKCEKAKKEN